MKCLMCFGWKDCPYRVGDYCIKDREKYKNEFKSNNKQHIRRSKK